MLRFRLWSTRKYHFCCVTLYGRFEILISIKEVSGALVYDAVKIVTVTDVSGDLSMPFFQNNISTLKIKVAAPSETSVSVCQFATRHISEDFTLHSYIFCMLNLSTFVLTQSTFCKVYRAVISLLTLLVIFHT